MSMQYSEEPDQPGYRMYIFGENVVFYYILAEIINQFVVIKKQFLLSKHCVSDRYFITEDVIGTPLENVL